MSLLVDILTLIMSVLIVDISIPLCDGKTQRIDRAWSADKSHQTQQRISAR